MPGCLTSQSVLGSPHASTAGTPFISIHAVASIPAPVERDGRTEAADSATVTASIIEGYTKPGQPGRIQLHYLQRAGITVWGSATQPTGIWRWTHCWTSPLICGGAALD